MIIDRELKIPVAFAYNKIITSVLDDIKQQTQKTLTSDQLDGFEYDKQFRNKAFAKMKIISAVENKLYEYETSTDRNDYHISYKLEPIDEHTTKLTYEEKMSSKGFIQSMNDALVAILTTRSRKKRFNKMFDQMEQSY